MILDVKGNINEDKILKRYDNIAKLIRKGEISDELGYALEAEILKLKSLFQQISTLPTGNDVTKSHDLENDSSEIFNYLSNVLKK